MEEINQYFSQIYDQYVVKIYRFIYLKVSTVEIAEDLSSEVFLRFFKYVQEAKPEIENPQAFLYRVARNVVADHYRTRKIQVVSVEETVDIISADSLQDQAVLHMEMDRVQKALATMQDDYQNLIIWRYLDELSVPEIAQITGKTEDNVRVGIHRALQSLRQRILV